MDWIREVKTSLNSHVSAYDRLLLAVSGGADSMGMLALLSDEFSMKGDRVVVGHVQHGIREGECEDIEVVSSWCDPRDIPVLKRRVNARTRAASDKMSLEAAARLLRYQALSEMADERRCEWILSAHTLDDSAETVWMRMRNGGPWYEWTGIPAQRGRILRPFLSVKRCDLKYWVGKHSIPYREDETNLDPTFLRNRVRIEMNSHPDFWNDQRKQELATAGDVVAKLIHFQKDLARVLPLHVSYSGKTPVIGLAIDGIFSYFKSLKFVPVEADWADLVGEPESRLPAAVRRQVDEFVSGRGTESTLVLPRDVRMIRRGSTIWLTSAPMQYVDQPVGLGTWTIAGRGATLTIKPRDNGSGVAVSSELAHHDLRVRTWLPGDRLRAAGRPRKKISDLLNEAALDPVTRENTLVLADEQGPLLILGGPVDERALAQSSDKYPLTVTWNTHD